MLCFFLFGVMLKHIGHVVKSVGRVSPCYGQLEKVSVSRGYDALEHRADSVFIVEIVWNKA